MTFEQFLAARLRALSRTALAMTGDVGLAEDLVQEVMIKAHARWDRIAEIDAPEAYVRRMLVNEFISWRRRWARVVPVADVLATDSRPDHADAVATRTVLDAHLSRLPQRQQAAVVLRYFDGLGDEEIADALGCRPGTVRSLVSRALATLRIDHALRDEFRLVAWPEGIRR